MKKAVELNLKMPWGKIAAKAWGNENNTHVLVVHGIMDNAGSFDRLIALLPETFYYVCIDLPGHGLSSHFPPGVPLNYITYILTLKYVLDELQWRQAYYIGHSLGAQLGLLISIIYPGRITKLILIDGIISRPQKNENIINRIRQEHDLAVEAMKVKNPRLYTKREVMYALTNLRKCTLKREAAEALFERAVTKLGDDNYYYNRDLRTKPSISPHFNLEQSFKIIEQIKVDTLFIMATNSLNFIQELKSELIKLLKKFNYVDVIEVRGNHDVHNNYPERISEHVKTFLNRIPSKL